MAKVKGTDGVVKIGANTVAAVSRFELDQQTEVIDNTDLAETDMVYEAGDSSWTANIECRWDKADTTGQGAMTNGATVSLNLQPEGDDTGDQRYSGSGIITGIQKANEKGSMVTQNFTIQGSGALTIDSVP